MLCINDMYVYIYIYILLVLSKKSLLFFFTRFSSILTHTREKFVCVCSLSVYHTSRPV